MRAAFALLFVLAYLAALALAPEYNPTGMSQPLRLLLLGCALGLVVSFLGFVLSFRPSAPRPLTPSGDAHAE